ncbi:hypothetical protein COSO111634_05245 [Corallococcus soli]
MAEKDDAEEKKTTKSADCSRATFHSTAEPRTFAASVRRKVSSSIFSSTRSFSSMAECTTPFTPRHRAIASRNTAETASGRVTSARTYIASPPSRWRVSRPSRTRASSSRRPTSTSFAWKPRAR